MSYQITVDWSPAYELIASLRAYVRESPKTLELPGDWWEHARSSVGPDLVTEDEFHSTGWLYLFAWLSPSKQDIPGFLHWLETRSVGEFYELLAPYIGKGCPALPRDLGAARDAAARFLRRWHEGYCRTVEPAILRAVEAEAAALRREATERHPEDLFERATHGIRFTPGPEVQTALLVPQYHYRPLDLQQQWRGLRLCLYPADVLPPAPGEPPPMLPRLARALDDHNRLRILRALAETPQSFGEIVQQNGLAKSTVHYHLTLLRAAGLLGEEDTGSFLSPVYRLRPSALDDLDHMLRQFLSGESRGSR